MSVTSIYEEDVDNPTDTLPRGVEDIKGIESSLAINILDWAVVVPGAKRNSVSDTQALILPPPDKATVLAACLNIPVSPSSIKV